MPRQGRDLERLVARLEKMIGGTNIEMKSPEYFIGMLSGERLKVDVTLRSNVGITQILVMIECRKRLGRGDTAWIQQLGSVFNTVSLGRTDELTNVISIMK